MQSLQCRQQHSPACGQQQQQRAIPCRAATVALQAHLRAPHALPIRPQSSSSTGTRFPHTAARAQAQEKVDQLESSSDSSQLVGEDAAAFDFSKQSLQSWGLFVALLSTVLGAMYLVSCSSNAVHRGSRHTRRSTPQGTHANSATACPPRSQP